MTDPAPPTLPDPAGLVLAPFRALRYAVVGPDLAAVTSPPYDVIDEEQRVRLEAADPHNVVRLILPRDDAGPDSRYAHAARMLTDWRRDGKLRLDARRALYVYEESVDGHVQRGLVGALALTPAAAGVVLPHENTMAGPVADRLALTEATGANLEPIFLVYDGGGPAAEVVRAVGDLEPTVSATTDDGVTHLIWALTDPGELTAVAADLLPRRAVIADGHHRYATYLQHQRDRHAAGAGTGPWDFGLTFLVDATTFGPQVHAIHRTVAGLPVAEAARRAASAFAVRRLDADLGHALDTLQRAGRSGPAFLLADRTSRVLLTAPDPAAVDRAVPVGRSPAWRGLDVTLVHRLLIPEVWGVPDTEDVIGFAHDVAAALAVADRSAGTAVLLNPTPVAAVGAVAAAGERMPRKSTLFTPKPRTGLVLRPFDA
jgi:uncharacterized protein (DUF1015 family)